MGIERNIEKKQRETDQQVTQASLPQFALAIYNVLFVPKSLPLYYTVGIQGH